ncbi:MAG: lipase maturation factor family protein [Verrucomicrobiota bacterium]
MAGTAGNTASLPCPADSRPGFSTAADLFLRTLAVVYFTAFASFWWQWRGLVGPEGLLPAQDYLDAVRQQFGAARWWRVPTLCWVFGAGWFLHVLCATGLALSVVLFLRILPPVCLALLWLCYLSLAPAGQDFLNFQWDTLLLETGLLAILLSPWGLRVRGRPEPPRLARWLLWWLLFRLMFMSGLVKLTSGDETWRNLTALTFHYETQPLPTWIGWWLHQMPVWFHRLSCAAMFAVELAGPGLLFGPRWLRHPAALAQIALQALIALTGNYTFFNLLTAALCLLFLDDGWWARWLRLKPATTETARTLPRPVLLGVAAVLFPASLWTTAPSLFTGVRWPDWYLEVYRTVSAARSVNSYGLFRVVTQTRPEIILEGSDDGREWKPYGFKWKPGDLARRPAFVAPHQPRLDWQLWFAALAHPRREPWVHNLCVHLLRGTPAVTALLGDNPFPDRPPRHVRAVLFEYRFTTPEEKARTGRWWRREPVDYYFPALSLKRR